MKPAAMYLRMSSAKQDTSIPDQRKAVKEYAKKNGFKLVAEYADHAISGDDTERRIEFQRMIADAVSGKFKFILCWDASRFGRFDLIEGGYWIRPLRDAGITLVTLDRGEISWNDFASRIIWSVETEGRHAYLRDLARNVMRGKLAAAQQGIWTGKPPFGYRLVDKRLAVHDEEASIVRQIFADYLAGTGLFSLANDLQIRGVRTSKGGIWGRTSLARLLRNTAYIGIYRWNHRSTAKYIQVTGGVCSEVTSKGRTIYHSEEDWVTIEDAHPPLVERDVFDAVQRELKVRQRCTTPGASKRFLLTGLLVCGHCGAPMHGRENKRSGVIRYTCGAYLRGVHDHANTVGQDEVLAAIIEQVNQRYCTARGIAALRKRAEKARARLESHDDQADVARKIDAIDAKLAKAKRRLVEVDSDLVGVVQDHIRELQQSREHLESQLPTKPIKPTDIDVGIDEVVQSYRKIVETLMRRNPADVKRWLRKIVHFATVTAVKRQAGSRSFHDFDSCDVNLHPASAVLSTPSEQTEQVCALLRRA
jgi:DNA invertase Pin-like site-specific DNA recombinase